MQKIEKLLLSNSSKDKTFGIKLATQKLTAKNLLAFLVFLRKNNLQELVRLNKEYELLFKKILDLTEDEPEHLYSVNGCYKAALTNSFTSQENLEAVREEMHRHIDTVINVHLKYNHG